MHFLLCDLCNSFTNMKFSYNFVETLGNHFFRASHDFRIFYKALQSFIIFLQVQIISGQLSRSLANSGNRSGKTLGKEFFENSVQCSRESLRSFFARQNLHTSLFSCLCLIFGKAKFWEPGLAEGLLCAKFATHMQFLRTFRKVCTIYFLGFLKNSPTKKRTKGHIS